MAKEVKKLNKIVAKSPDQAKAQNKRKLEVNATKKYYGVEKPVTRGVGRPTVIEPGNKSNKLLKSLPSKTKPAPGESARRQAKPKSKDKY